MWIGLDDTDSKDGGCTTFICFEFVYRLYQKGYCLRSYPRLIRLNPQVPWKTRGNGAVAFHIGKRKGGKILFGRKNDYSLYLDPDASSKEIDEKEIISLLKEVLNKYAEVESENTNPAFVFVSQTFSDNFYKKAVHELVTINEAIEIIKHEKGSYFLIKNGRGVIGATAAISWDQKRDHTFELISYRDEARWKTPRYVAEESVKKMDDQVSSTFDNYDYENRYNSIVPHSPCPILFGIRGDDVSMLPLCQKMIQSEQSIGWMIYISNQGTDDHVKMKNISMIEPFQSVIVQGNVSSIPSRTKGGHIFFKIKDNNGDYIDCAAYEPTKEFRKVIERLHIGDYLEVYGGIREEPLTINIEKIRIIDLVEVFEKSENPLCPVCNKHMKSRGNNQGYKCKACKTLSNEPVMKRKDRELSIGFYEVPVCARRHLSKPLKRMKTEIRL